MIVRKTSTSAAAANGPISFRAATLKRCFVVRMSALMVPMAVVLATTITKSAAVARHQTTGAIGDIICEF